jgi:hypothetical protein
MIAVRRQRNALQSVLDNAKRHIETTMYDMDKQWLECMIQRVTTVVTDASHRSDPTTDDKNEGGLKQKDDPNRFSGYDNSHIRTQIHSVNGTVSSSSSFIQKKKAHKRQRSTTSSDNVHWSKNFRGSATISTATTSRVDSVKTSLLHSFNSGSGGMINTFSSLPHILTLPLSSYSSANNTITDGKNQHISPVHPSDYSANSSINVDSSAKFREMIRPNTNIDISTKVLEANRHLLCDIRERFFSTSTHASNASPRFSLMSPASDASSNGGFIFADQLQTQHTTNQQLVTEGNEAIRRSAHAAINMIQQQLQRQEALQSLEQQQRLSLFLSLYDGGGSLINSNTRSTTPTFPIIPSLPQQPVTREGDRYIQSLSSLLESSSSTATQNINQNITQSFSSFPSNRTHSANTY